MWIEDATYPQYLDKKRGQGRFKSTYTLDYGLTLNYRLTGTLALNLTVDVFNVLNHQIQEAWDTTMYWDEEKQALIQGEHFGKATSASQYIPPRTARIALGIRF